jgi:DNA-binding NtrC family response regulator
MARILVIDDEEDVLLAVTRRLARDGHEVVPATNAEQGIGKIQRSPETFDVVITDMSMENPSSGLAVLQAAFARDILAEVIVMTAYGNVANAVECMRRGAFDYIEKNQPGVDTYDLLASKVEMALDRRRRDLRTLETWERTAKTKVAARK